MKDLYSYLNFRKYSNQVVYEIVPNSDDSEYKRLVNNIYNLNIDPKKKTII